MMVRKPVATPQGQATQRTPYPATPTSPREGKVKISIPPDSTNLERYTAGTNQVDVQSDSSDNLSGWQEANERARHQGQPSSLVVARGRQDAESRSNADIPAALKVGSTEVTPRSSWESQRSEDSTTNASSSKPLQSLHAAPEQTQAPRSRSSSNNPYRRMHGSNGKAPERSQYSGESNAEIWVGDSPAIRSHTESMPSRQPFAEPWMQFGTSPGEQESEPAEGPYVAGIKSKFDPPTGQTSSPMNQRASEAPEVHIQSPRSPQDQNSQPNSLAQRPRYPLDDFDQNSLNLATVVDHSLPYSSYGVNETFHTASNLTENTSTQDTNRVDQNDVAGSRDAALVPLLPSFAQDVTPPLPPRPSEEKQGIPPPQPLRPPKTGGMSCENASPAPEAQAEREDTAKTRGARETYQIRLVNWYDASSPTNPRRSPIMVQNANGPCPLLALVNALVLSTPSNTETALVETLRVREQVSLGLLLDAVIDELMSGRRSDEGNLPDVTDLYAFLITLHTGMNVNPRFVPIEETVNLMDAPIDGDLPTNLHAARKAGGFEDTREMKLYSTFAIPLIHGWIPPRNHPAFAALKRTAKTYEDAQNVMFREEELEEKLQRQGLTQEEQTILEDIASVKYFLSTTATQLTGYGLDTMTETMAPGSIAILFRNDHFSTLYRHPRSGQLLTLVTDMGYAGHDEVVWESLVDVSGEGCEFFSGDFRPVGNIAGDTQQQPAPPPAEDEEGWTTVNNKSRRAPQPSGSGGHSNLPPISTLNLNNKPTPLSSNIEQEDHDLALAMQLQEEEEERDRQEAAARRREDELSQAYLNSSDAQGRRTFPGFGRGATGARGGPSPPPRGAGRGRHPPPRQTPRKSGYTESEDAPPPSYEQAAKGPAYVPPTNHPAHPYASPGSSNSAPRQQGQRPRQSSAYSEQADSFAGSPTYANTPRQGHVPRRGGRGGVDQGGGRRRSGAPGSAVSLDEEKKEKDCIVM